MRMCYSITGAGAEPGLRGCTQALRAGKCSKPSSRSRPSRVVPAQPRRAGPAAEGISVAKGPSGLPRRGGSQFRPATVLARPPGLRAAEPGLGH